MTYGPIPICFFCIHLDESTRFEGGLKCAAFPGGVPQKILANTHDHRYPLGGEETAEGVPILFTANSEEAKKVPVEYFD